MNKFAFSVKILFPGSPHQHSAARLTLALLWGFSPKAPSHLPGPGEDITGTPASRCHGTQQPAPLLFQRDRRSRMKTAGCWRESSRAAHLPEVPGGGAEDEGGDDHEAGVVEEHPVLAQLLRQRNSAQHPSHRHSACLCSEHVHPGQLCGGLFSAHFWHKMLPFKYTVISEQTFVSHGKDR